MNYLIDTHILVWLISGNSALSKKFVKEIDNPINKIYLSNASLWEIAIKVNLKKLDMSISFGALEAFLIDNNFLLLEYNYQDLSQLINLPKHHRDPFDRLIIAQAITNNFTIITDDKKFQQYPVQLL